MLIRICLCLAVLNQLSACIATPRIEIAQKFDFNYQMPDHRPMSYDDLLCCYDCTA